MTTIAAAVQDGELVMGADGGRYTSSGRIVRSPLPKIWRHSGLVRYHSYSAEMVMGFTGLFSLAQAVRHHWEAEYLPNPDDQSDCDAFMQTMAEAVTSLAAELRAPEGEDVQNWAGLVGCAGQMYELGPDYAMRLSLPYHAIGQGSDIAIGVLAATLNVPLTLEVVSQHDDACVEPFIFERLE